ncbi:MAG TPA: response regulator transcription factor [Kineosporiaceae bacterium]
MTETRRVLLVDDQPMVTEALAVALDEQPDLQVVGRASTRAAALAAVRALRPDVVTIEVELRDGSGFEALADLRREDPDLLVVVLSQTDDAAAVAEGLRRRVSAWVAKTEPVQHLLDVLRSLRPGDCYIPPALLPGAVRVLVQANEASVPGGPLDALTPREAEVLGCMVDGLAREEIAARLHLSPHTIRTHTQNLLAKLGVHSVVEAVALAMQSGLRPTPRRR